jgi:hypothetical protein
VSSCGFDDIPYRQYRTLKSQKAFILKGFFDVNKLYTALIFFVDNIFKATFPNFSLRYNSWGISFTSIHILWLIE